MNKFKLLSVFVLIAVVLSACGGGAVATSAPAATEAPVMTEAPAATQAPAATEAPASLPDVAREDSSNWF